MAASGTKTEGGDAQGFVTVGVRLPNGLVLRTFKMVKEYEPVMAGTREFTIAREFGPRHVLHGYAAEPGRLPKVPVIWGAGGSGYAINHGVPAAIWEVWLEQNREHPLVANGVVFAFPHPDATEARARELAGQRTGLEPMTQEEYDESDRVIPSTIDPRTPRGPKGMRVRASDMAKGA